MGVEAPNNNFLGLLIIILYLIIIIIIIKLLFNTDNDIPISRKDLCPFSV